MVVAVCIASMFDQQRIFSLQKSLQLPISWNNAHLRLRFILIQLIKLG